MTDLTDWLEGVFARGEAIVPSNGEVIVRDRARHEALLKNAFRVHALDVGGPPLNLDTATAFAASELLAVACHRLVAGEGTLSSVERLVPPRSAAEHLSSDLCLQFLPAVLQRARAQGMDELLIGWSENLLRRWPLSGVLADLDAPPIEPPDFFGHPGLQLLYSERLLKFPRANWLPNHGLAREQVERVFGERKRPLPLATTAIVQESP